MQPSGYPPNAWRVPGQPYQPLPPPSHNQTNRHSQAYNPPPQSHYNQYPPPTSTPYVQPYYGSPAPQFIAELPAPLPPAPATTTPQQQLTEDERLAHKIQQMEIEEARKRSNSSVSQLQPPLTPRLGAPPPRPHSHSFSTGAAYTPEPFGPPPTQGSPSLLPEVIAGPRPVSFHEMSRPHSQVIPPPAQQYIPQLPPAPTDPASLSAYLEKYRQVPYPRQWILAPVVATFYASSSPAPKSDWLDTPESRTWRTVRFSEHAQNSTPPSFHFHFKSKSGGSFRDPKFSWTMTCGSGKKDKLSKIDHPVWTYDLRLDKHTGKRKIESLAHAKGRDMLTTYVHALNYDSLRFIGPDGRAYMWVSHAPVSTLNGARYDTLRHALFVSTETSRDPLYGRIIADHTFWDGFVDKAEVHIGVTCAGCNASPINGLRWICRTCPSHNLCDLCQKANLANTIEPSCDMSLVSLPDEALYIRSSSVDPALVVASLQVLKDWEMHTFREQKAKDAHGFETAVEKARQCDLGRMSYWRAGDMNPKATEKKFGTVIKAKECVRAAAEIASALGNIAEAVGDGSGGGDGGGGGDSGGGGGGGGDGGGGGGGAC